MRNQKSEERRQKAERNAWNSQAVIFHLLSSLFYLLYRCFLCARKIFFLGGIFFVSSFPLSAYAADNTLAQQRHAFLAALSDLQHGKQQEFLLIAQQLRHYPLYPYLVYADVALHLKQASPATIANFLQTYSDTPLANHLRNLWLAQLAQQQQWPQFLAFYRHSDNINLQCTYRQALWQTGQATAATQNFLQLLEKSTHPPQSCLWVLAAAVHQGTLGESLVWQRIAIAFQHKDVMSAEQYASLLSPANKQRFLLWQRLYQNPALALQAGIWPTAGSLAGAMLETVLQRTAVRNPYAALQLWQQLHQRNTFSVDATQRATRVVAMALAEAHASEALQWLAALMPAYSNNDVAEWRVRSALYQQQWPAVRAAIALLPPKTRQLPTWRYWKARALAAQGFNVQAREIYRNLALQGDFYGQLASLQLQQPPLLALKTLTVNRAQIASLATLPAMQRAYELYQLHWLPEAHQEWEWALTHLPEADYLAAAELAISWGWFDQAIATVKHIDAANDMSLRFPLAYRPNILNTARRMQLNPAWMFALIRQESLFSPQVRSSAGALGLMQILPDTGQLLARQLHVAFTPRDLLDPDTNLLLGSIYLKRLLLHFQGNMVLATAAYNAGPGRVLRWLPAQPLPVDIWIETIPWYQTRNYVKNIMASTTFYEKQLDLPTSLKERLGNKN